ncbi:MULTISPECIES: transposase [Okeania]|uniref:transposase n=1 Tax=Okeania TaxID=1458928 RepID=UPI000F54AEBB|nr:transposase [Okeania hirsuta]
MTDSEWQEIFDFLPPPNSIGSPRLVDLREIVNAIFYWVDNGIKWRALPHDFPCW